MLVFFGALALTTAVLVINAFLGVSNAPVDQAGASQATAVHAVVPMSSGAVASSTDAGR